MLQSLCDIRGSHNRHTNLTHLIASREWDGVSNQLRMHPEDARPGMFACHLCPNIGTEFAAETTVLENKNS